MKKIRLILLLLFIPLLSEASPQVSGYITVKYTGAYTCEAIVIDYTIGDPQNSRFCDTTPDIDTLRLYWGDGTSSLLSRSNRTGDSVCECRKVNIYATAVHTYGGPGTYRMSYNAGQRVPNIQNISPFIIQDMIIFHTLTISPMGNSGFSSPVITNPPLCTYGCPTACYYFNLGAVSPDNNEISYSLGPCLSNVPGYYNPGATIDSNTGELTWCNPSLGLWNFSMRVTTYSITIIGGNPIKIPVDTEEVELEVDIQSNCSLGVNELTTKNEEVNIYPNPSNGLFTLVIVGEAKQSPGTIEVYNVLGERVYNATLQPQTPKGALNEINLNGQPNGVYFYRVLDKNGALVGDGKLIITH